MYSSYVICVATHFDSWELRSTEAVRLSAPPSNETTYLSRARRRLPESHCERDDQQVTGAPFIFSSEQPGTLALTCGQSCFHMQMCFINFLYVLSAERHKPYRAYRHFSNYITYIYLEFLIFSFVSFIFNFMSLLLFIAHFLAQPHQHETLYFTAHSTSV